MLSIYPACFYKEKDGYSVIFPDLNYLATQGDTLEDAMEMAVECLAAHLHSCKADKEEIPAPSNLTDIDPVAVSKQGINFSQNFFTFPHIPSAFLPIYCRYQNHHPPPYTQSGYNSIGSFLNH
ncbi:MAG TPA: hypothetical protein DEO89_02780 [Lachnospiraceae bacterium]|nr:hypothetical protein [Lachnospiraceae bacterium]